MKLRGTLSQFQLKNAFEKPSLNRRHGVFNYTGLVSYGQQRRWNEKHFQLSFECVYCFSFSFASNYSFKCLHFSLQAPSPSAQLQWKFCCTFISLQLLFKVKTCWTIFTFKVLWNSCNLVIKKFQQHFMPSPDWLLIRFHPHMALAKARVCDMFRWIISQSPIEHYKLRISVWLLASIKILWRRKNGLRIDICDRLDMIYYGKM